MAWWPPIEGINVNHRGFFQTITDPSQKFSLDTLGWGVQTTSTLNIYIFGGVFEKSQITNMDDFYQIFTNGKWLFKITISIHPSIKRKLVGNIEFQDWIHLVPIIIIPLGGLEMSWNKGMSILRCLEVQINTHRSPRPIRVPSKVNEAPCRAMEFFLRSGWGEKHVVFFLCSGEMYVFFFWGGEGGGREMVGGVFFLSFFFWVFCVSEFSCLGWVCRSKGWPWFFRQKTLEELQLQTRIVGLVLHQSPWKKS